VNIRKGDLIEDHTYEGSKINEHKYGYRSIHYLIQSMPNKEIITSEIQVRTIFEEGWSEIDHHIRYPYDVDNPVLKPYISIFNRLAGSSDEMGSYIKFLKFELENIHENYKKQIIEKDKFVSEFKIKLDAMEISLESKNLILEEVENLQKKLTIGVIDSNKNNLYIQPLDIPEIPMAMPLPMPMLPTGEELRGYFKNIKK
jgi:putative GTP pyrophosphokinase